MKKLNKFTLSGTIILLIMSFGVSVSAKEKQGLRNLDKDENGKITFEEFSYKHQKIFNNMDKDSDGFISRDEIDRKREGKNNISRYADRLDLNNDLKIDKNEFIRGQSNRFKRDQRPQKIDVISIVSKEGMSLKRYLKVQIQIIMEVLILQSFQR